MKYKFNYIDPSVSKTEVFTVTCSQQTFDDIYNGGKIISKEPASEWDETLKKYI